MYKPLALTIRKRTLVTDKIQLFVSLSAREMKNAFIIKARFSLPPNLVIIVQRISVQRVHPKCNVYTISVRDDKTSKMRSTYLPPNAEFYWDPQCGNPVPTA